MFLALPKDTISLEQMFKIKTSNNGYYVSREYEQIWTYEYLFSRGWFVGISLVLGVIVTLIISVTPIVRWYCGVRDGVVSIAEIVSVKMTVQESTVVYTIMGDWRIMTQGRSVFQTSFKTYTRKRESWWMSLAPGDRILVLVHPTKPKVLAELGPVDAEPRVPLPAIPELAAKRTNGA
jgi:hypothetical protein